MDCQVVISALDGGPAARAGIQSGDELLQIDGNSQTLFFLNFCALVESLCKNLSKLTIYKSYVSSIRR